MTNEADLVAGVRRRFAETDTDVLRAMWGSEDRTDWAEAALRDELIARGDSPEVLDAIAARREEIAANAPPDAKELRWEYGIQGRLLTMAAVFLWCFLVHVTVRWAPPGLGRQHRDHRRLRLPPYKTHGATGSPPFKRRDEVCLGMAAFLDMGFRCVCRDRHVVFVLLNQLLGMAASCEP
ncbi:hypothetical protein ABIE56_003495 [Luteibacter sp. 621]|uniref:hypothetical protein n=1 Tax=Luteibacter sp. 621 TaxID=3373916 RepID=UPI003D1D7C2B